MTNEIQLLAKFLSKTMQYPVWQDDGLLKLYLYCLSNASHNTYMWRGILIQPGDLPLSERHVSKILAWSRSKLDRKIKQLCSTGLVSVHAVPQTGTMVHVEHWPRSEASQIKTGPAADPVHIQSKTSSSNNSSIDCPQNKTSLGNTSCRASPVLHQNEASFNGTGLILKPNPLIEKKDSSMTTAAKTEPDGFTEIWISYPVNRRTRRAEAAELVRDALSNGASIEAILKALEEDRRSVEWQKENGRYIPGIVNWLLKETWRGYMEPKPREEDGEQWISR